MAIAKIEAFLYEQGVRHKEDLPLDLLSIMERLEQDKNLAHKAHWDLLLMETALAGSTIYPFMRN